VLGSRTLPFKMKLAAALVLSMLVAPLLPASEAVPDAAVGGRIAARELLIGLAIGFVLRIALSAADMAGQLIGLQSGVKLSVPYDPQGLGPHPGVGHAVGVFAVLVFLAANGHLVILTAVVDSFEALPVGASGMDASGWRALAGWAAIIFSAGLTIALPVIAALMIANVALGVAWRGSQRFELLAVGLPALLLVGLAALYVAVGYVVPALEDVFEHAPLAVRRVLRSFAGQ
jgi:flagellar biosynthetic protein FliR